MRREDPDYWEPSRPLLRAPDSMERYPPAGFKVPRGDGSRTRWNTLTMDVLYLDFRAEMSAFDAVFHHGYLPDPTVSQAQAQNSRKASIRSWAPRLKRAITEGLRTDTKYRSERIVTPARELEQDQLDSIGEILGRAYQSITVVEHRYFGKTDGWTAVLHSDTHDYTEAFAGSGEFAVVMLVMKVMSAKPHTLILLDEPEVSLHPTAQHRLMEFLGNQAKSRRHQVVLATHSADIIRHLPANAIKVLNRNTTTAQVELPLQDCPPNVAFEAIGAPFTHPTVVVEDDLSKVVVQQAISKEPWASTLDVVVRPGGAARIWTQHIADWAFEGRTDVLVYFDGDQDCGAPLGGDQLGNDSVEAEVRNAFHGHLPRVQISGGASATHNSEKLIALRHALDWRRANVAFLPFATPESFVYDHAPGAAQAPGHDTKKLWVEYVKDKQAGPDEPSSPEILGMQKQVLNDISYEDAAFQAIRARVKQFVDGVAT
jgi:hypothetical protein